MAAETIGYTPSIPTRRRCRMGSSPTTRFLTSVNCQNLFDERYDPGVFANCQRDVHQRATGYQGDLTGILPDGTDNEIDGVFLLRLRVRVAT